MTTVLIAEKPSMALDIANALAQSVQKHDGYYKADQYLVTHAVGHMLSQADPDAYDPRYKAWSIDHLPIIPKDWMMQANPKFSKQIAVIESLLKKATLVINCGDAAREGQLIVDELIHFCGYTGDAKRLWLQAQNPAAIKKAFSLMKPNSEYRNLSFSALARARADWLFGMNMTRGYSKAWETKSKRKEPLHLGRVKTPIMCLVVELELAIEAFIPVKFFVLRADFKHINGVFTATWQPPENAAYLTNGKVIDQKVVDRVVSEVKGKPAAIRDYTTTPKADPAPLPFSLGDLQKEASRVFGLEPNETLAIAQILYEKHKLISYPRTDYSHMPADEFPMAEKFLAAAKSCMKADWDFPGQPDFTIKGRAWDDSKIGDHFGLRPTSVKNYDMTQLTATERGIHKLIVRNFLAQFYPHYQYNSTTLQATCEKHTFTTSGTVQTAAGWKILWKGGDDPAKDKDVVMLPQMASGDACQLTETTVEVNKTTAPKRLTGGELIEKMEKAHTFVADESLKSTLKGKGIGTPATRANILAELVDGGYFEQAQEKGKGKGKGRKIYVPTKKAVMLYHALPPFLRKPDMTAKSEDQLQDIEAGKLPMKQFMRENIEMLSGFIDEIKSGQVANRMIPYDDDAGDGKRTEQMPATSRVCPKCGKAMKSRPGPKGEFFGCSGYPACKHTEQAST